MTARSTSKRGSRCFYCKSQLTALVGQKVNPSTIYTKDHILPLCRGRMFCPTVKNIRHCCYDCNQLRATINHCAGLMTLAHIEAFHRRTHVREVLVQLGLRRSAKEKLARRREKTEKQALLRRSLASMKLWHNFPPYKYHRNSKEYLAALWAFVDMHPPFQLERPCFEEVRG